MSINELKNVFTMFAAFGERHEQHHDTMDNVHFTKLVRDCKLTDGLLTPSQVDIIFAKAKAKGSRRINFKEFIKAIDLIAYAKYGNDSEGPLHIRQQIIHSSGPQLDNVHLPVSFNHTVDRLTDTRLYGGIHKGRFDEEGRGRGKEGRDAPALGVGTVNQYSEGVVGDLSQIVRPQFRGGTHLSNYTRTVSPVRSPLGITSPRSAVLASPSYQTTHEKNSSPVAAIQQRYPSPGGSETSVTGRPATAPTIRSPNQYETNNNNPFPSNTSTTTPSRNNQSATNPSISSSSPYSLHKTPKVVIESAELQAIFYAYCAFGTTSKLLDELDSGKFAKLCRECGIVDGKIVPPAMADVAFAKVKQQQKRTISYIEFQQALAVLAPLRYANIDVYQSLQSIVESIIRSGGPVCTTAAVPVQNSVIDRLTSTKHYTGMHREKFEELEKLQNSQHHL